jgi:excisionase family DNA binding protein
MSDVITPAPAHNPFPVDENHRCRRLLTIQEARGVLRCSVARVYSLIHAGEIEAIKDGRLTFIDAESVERRQANLPAWTAPGDR